MASTEQTTFLGGRVKISVAEDGCCHKRSTALCCHASFLLGLVLLVLGLAALITGPRLLAGAILDTMALHQDSDRCPVSFTFSISIFVFIWISVKNNSELFPGYSPGWIPQLRPTSLPMAFT